MDYKNVVTELAAAGILIGNPDVGYNLNPYLKLPKSLKFSDVALVQKKNSVKSRLDTDISSEFVRGLSLKIPLLAANMSSVTDASFCIHLYKLGALGVLHRAWKNTDDYLKEVATIAAACDITAAAVGASSEQFEFGKKLIKAGANILVVDIAQGYSDYVIEIGARLKKYSPSTKIVVGNTVNTDMMYDVSDFADAVKVGIAQGSACETKSTAGATEGQWSAVYKFKDISRKLGLPIISDGSVSEPSDFVKGMAAGAASVMAGSIFARCPESAADTVIIDGEVRKHYFGMASTTAQDRWRGGLKPGTCAEGKSLFLPLGQSVEKLVQRYGGALRSGMTYTGANDIEGLWKKASFIRL